MLLPGVLGVLGGAGVEPGVVGVVPGVLGVLLGWPGFTGVVPGIPGVVLGVLPGVVLGVVLGTPGVVLGVVPGVGFTCMRVVSCGTCAVYTAPLQLAVVVLIGPLPPPLANAMLPLNSVAKIMMKVFTS